jgi:hypothetical protein
LHYSIPCNLCLCRWHTGCTEWHHKGLWATVHSNASSHNCLLGHWHASYALQCVFVLHNGEMFCKDYLCGIPGLAFGMTTGTWVHMLLLLCIVICTTNWSVQATRAKECLVHDKIGGPVVRKDEANEIGIMSL